MASGNQPQHNDAMIAANTGRTWAEWTELLDGWGARDRSHTEIAAHVASLGVDGWWAQGVTVGYERLIGRREVGQRVDGLYSGSASKTVGATAERACQAITDDIERRQWLYPDVLTLRTVQPGKSARFDLEGGGILAVYFTAKGEKTAVQVQLEKLPSREAADAFRTTWKSHLAALDAYLRGVA